jgi:cellobiose phosphorylase
MNGFMYHLKEQVTFCSEIKGYIQLSHFSLIGIRDIFQALEGYLFYEPHKAKVKMLEALDFTSLSGQLPRQYSLPKHANSLPAMDLRPFIDQGVWVISTIMTYLRFTKDWSFLDEECGYYDFIDQHKHIAKKNNVKESVLMHMIRIMDYLLENRDHDNTKCVLALYGDWNDALDGLGRSQDPNKEYGSGVSVMATLQVYQNLCEMLELLMHLEEQKPYCHLHEALSLRKEAYVKAKDQIKEGLLNHAIDGDHIIHGWGDQKSYLVGSLNDPDGVARDGLTSQAFWILSGFLQVDPHHRKHRDYILKAYKRLDSKYGYQTFEPYFEKGTQGVGRIPNLPKGTAENGATYIHASMFAVMSLFAIGEGELAWEQLKKLFPFTHEEVSVSPFVLPNSYGDNEEFHIDGESMQDWQTGSSNVLFKLFVRYVLGFEPVLGGLLIQPSRYQIFETMSLRIKYLNHNVLLKYIGKPTKSTSNREFKVNGLSYQGQYNSTMQMHTLLISDETIQSLEKEIIIEVKDM